MKDKPEIERRSGYGHTAAIPGLKQNDTTDRVADNHISDLNKCETVLPDVLANFPEAQLDLTSSVDLKTMSAPELDLADPEPTLQLEKIETAAKPAANTEWILMGIPLDRYEAAQQHIAALEAMAGVTVKKSTT
jgi:hypothetical protein